MYLCFTLKGSVLFLAREKQHAEKGGGRKIPVDFLSGEEGGEEQRENFADDAEHRETNCESLSGSHSVDVQSCDKKIIREFCARKKRGVSCPGMAVLYPLGVGVGERVGSARGRGLEALEGAKERIFVTVADTFHFPDYPRRRAIQNLSLLNLIFLKKNIS